MGSDRGVHIQFGCRSLVEEVRLIGQGAVSVTKYIRLEIIVYGACCRSPGADIEHRPAGPMSLPNKTHPESKKILRPASVDREPGRCLRRVAASPRGEVDPKGWPVKIRRTLHLGGVERGRWRL